jgi:polyphosphate glucokinase
MSLEVSIKPSTLFVNSKATHQMNILVIDVGGTHIKAQVTGSETRVKIPSGKEMTAAKMVECITKETADWDYDVVSIGYPGPVHNGKIVNEPHNLGDGWVDYNFEHAFLRPLKIINDAAMQALGSYEGNSMLFLGLGTGLGSTMISDGQILPMELAHLPYKKKRSYEDYVGIAGLQRMGKLKWRRHVLKIIDLFKAALQVDYVVLGGGNAELVKELPIYVHLGDNANAFTGGCRLWDKHQDLKKSNS